MSPDLVAIYHKNPKVKVSDVLTGFCRAPKFCDRHTDRHTHTLSVSNSHCQFLTQLKLRKDKFFRFLERQLILKQAGLS